MPIDRLLSEQTVFTPDEIAVLVAAFEDAIVNLRTTNRVDGAPEIIAKRIVELAVQGERDPIKLRDGALQYLSEQPPVLQRPLF